jgi:hypothetical protein
MRIKSPSQLPGIVPEALTSKPVLTTQEVAALLQIQPRQVQRLGVPQLKLGHKTRRYSLRVVLAWLETHATAA